MKRISPFPYCEDFFHSLESRVNPANGLPMIEGSSFDIAGNVYGSNFTSGGYDELSSVGNEPCDFGWTNE